MALCCNYMNNKEFKCRHHLCVYVFLFSSTNMKKSCHIFGTPYLWIAKGSIKRPSFQMSLCKNLFCLSYCEFIQSRTRWWATSKQLHLLIMTYIQDITKFKLWKGTKTNLFATQGMADTSSWWCFLDSPMHSPHFAHS